MRITEERRGGIEGIVGEIDGSGVEKPIGGDC